MISSEFIISRNISRLLLSEIGRTHHSESPEVSAIILPHILPYLRGDESTRPRCRFTPVCPYEQCGRVSKGVGHLAHVWRYGVRKVVSSIPGRGNIVGWVFHPARWLARFSLIWICLSFQILNLFRTLSSWGSDNHRASAPLLYEVASHVK